MIRRLRTRHRYFWLSLAVLLPIALWLTLSQRPDEPVSPSLVSTSQGSSR